jgi:DNA-binding CsgD family transcriptional regulator
LNNDFTHRELQIMRLMCDGNFCDKELASALDIAPDTVAKHLANIYGKLREKLQREEISRLDLVIYSIFAGYADTGKLRARYAIPDERMAAVAPL